MTSRIITRLEMRLEDKDRLLRSAKRFGMTQLSCTDRLVKWFEQQPESIQREILAEDNSRAWRSVLQNMMAGGRGDGQVEEPRRKAKARS